jgi:hypothetical protein
MIYESNQMTMRTMAQKKIAKAARKVITAMTVMTVTTAMPVTTATMMWRRRSSVKKSSKSLLKTVICRSLSMGLKAL